MADGVFRVDHAPRRMTTEQADSELRRLRSLTPLGTRFASMTPDELKKELSDRSYGLNSDLARS